MTDPRVRILDSSPNDRLPYLHLMPIVHGLVAAGNTVDGRFTLTKSGWYCSMRDPIDFDVIRSQFELPATITLSEQYDTVLDEATLTTIEGRRAWHPRMQRGFVLKAEQALEGVEPPVQISADSPSRFQGFVHLNPVVGLLVKAGNEIGECNWSGLHRGVECRFARPIEFDVLERTFAFPPTIVLDREHDRIVDTKSGYVIRGPEAT